MPLLRILIVSAWTVAFAFGLGSAPEILTFDDLSPPSDVDLPLYDPPDPYNGLHFTRFSVFEPRNRSLDNFLHPLDRNCAVSAPNALLGSAADVGATVAAFEVAASQDGRPHQDIVSFDLTGMAMKPLIAPPGKEEITIWVKGYSASGADASGDGDGDGDGELLWHVDFPVGWHTPFVPSFPEHWRGLRKVEMWAEYGPTKLDWEFCIDNVRLRWNRRHDDPIAMEL